MASPNVLLICTDHWPGRLLGCAGHPAVMTPTLDQLAANGVRYSNAYSATPMCIPARRGLMTGACARTHGDRIFNETLRMPDLPTLAGAFRGAGYQTYAVGKLHVYPQRDRIGFDDVLLNEDGRHHLGMGADDYELFLAAEGYAGQELTHGAGTNDYMVRPWHLPEYLHPTNWEAYEMCRAIKRRDPTRPAFWYLSFNRPHPPLTPPACYLDMYRDVDIPLPPVGDWAADFEGWPYALKLTRDMFPKMGPAQTRLTLQGFYALCTHIDHQMRLVIGMLREEGLLDDTIIAFTSDHGDMMGAHDLFAMSIMYEEAAKIPMIIVPTAGYHHLGHHRVDDRLVELRDIMPTLLEMAGIPIPETVEGVSLLGDTRRDHLYGEHFENDRATRMIRTERHKLIYYPLGNRVQLFDLVEDPDELRDLAGEPAQAGLLEELTDLLIAHLYGGDLEWVRDGRLVGLPDKSFTPGPNRGLTGQRGWRFM
jgi:arylsulfatase